jgi:hypothetical protein
VAPTWSTCPVGTGGGTVTSVGLTTPSWLAVAGSPVTASGTLAVTPAGGQLANSFLASPNGAAGPVGLRTIVPGDLAGGVNASATTCYFGDNSWKNCGAGGGGGSPPGGTNGQIQYNNSGLFGGFTPGGDVSFANPNFTVTGLQGRQVSNTAPTANQVLAWNGSIWTPTNPGGGGGGTVPAYTVTPFSATPTFTVTASTSIQNFRINLTGNVTSSTLGTASATVGQDIAFIICQDGTGGRTFAWPSNVPAHMVVDPTANACSRQAFRWDGANAQQIAPGVSDTATPGLITSTGILSLPAAPDTLMGRASADTMTGNKTFTGTTDASGAAHTLPSKVGTVATRPATCTVGEQYFATDATAGQNLYFCTTANTWTLMTGGGAGAPANATVCQDASASATTYTCPTPSPNVTSYTGMLVDFSPQTTNSGPATLNVAGLGAKALKWNDCTTNIASNQLIGGKWYHFLYNGTNLCRTDNTYPLEVTAEMFGAAGDATTNDSTAMQAAINFLGSAGGGVLRLAAKNYAVNTLPIVINKSYVSISGLGAQVSLLTSTDTTHDFIQVIGTGPNCQTGSIALNRLEHFSIARTTIAQVVKGINLTDTCWPYVYDVWANNSASNFYLAGAANAVLHHTQAWWSGGSDSGLYGYERDSTVGAQSASTHYINTLVACTGNATGYYDHGGIIADFDGYDMETATCGNAVNITSTCTGTPTLCDGDWMMMHSVFDQSSGSCIVVNNVNHGPRAGITLDHVMCDGNVSGHSTIDIENSVVNLGVGSTLRANGTNNVGVNINGALSAGTTISGVQFMDIQTGVQILGSASNINVIGNTFVNSTTTVSATADISIATGSTNIIAIGNTFRGYATAGINNAGNGNYLWPNTCAPPNITTCLTDTGTQPADMTNAGVVAKIQGKAVDVPLTKGDLLVYDGTALKRLGVGTDGQVLTAASAQATGINWAAGGGGPVGPTYLPYADAAICLVFGSPSGTYMQQFSNHFAATIGLSASSNLNCHGTLAQADPPIQGGWTSFVLYPGTNGTYYEGQFTIGTMPGWTSGHRVDVNLYWSSDVATSTPVIAWRLSFGCLHLPNTGNLYGATVFSNFQTLSVTSAASSSAAMTTFTGLTVPAACTNATDHFLLRVARQQGANGDTTATTDNAYLLGAQVLWN